MKLNKALSEMHKVFDWYIRSRLEFNANLYQIDTENAAFKKSHEEREKLREAQRTITELLNTLERGLL